MTFGRGGAAPDRVIIAAHLSPRTAEALDGLGVEVLPLDYAEMWSGGGGIHCSTAPLVRDPL